MKIESTPAVLDPLPLEPGSSSASPWEASDVTVTLDLEKAEATPERGPSQKEKEAIIRKYISTPAGRSIVAQAMYAGMEERRKREVLAQEQRARMTVDCEKHGSNHRAIPVINGVIEPYAQWPEDVEDVTKYERVCTKCLAESMIPPRRSPRYDYSKPRTKLEIEPLPGGKAT